MPKKRPKNKKNISFVFNIYQSVTHVSTCIFHGLFKTKALVTEKLWAIVDFFLSQLDIFSALYLIPFKLKKIFFQLKIL